MFVVILCLDHTGKVIDYLVDHDNVGFALRLLLSSWYIDENTLDEIIPPYATKIVSSDTFDSALAASTLSVLSQSQTMKVLREVIPRIRNDFKRLQMLATVGSELANLWSHNEFSFMCEQVKIAQHVFCSRVDCSSSLSEIRIGGESSTS